MALTAAEEAQTRELLAQQAAILALAAEEPAITSSLGATDVSLSDLTSATALSDTDLLLVRQGTTDKSISGLVVKSSASVADASETVKGIVELATSAETIAGTSSALAVHPSGLASLTSTESRAGLIEIATGAEVQAGTDSTRAVVPSTLFSAMASIMTHFGFAISLTSNGYIKFPSILGGLIIQWGSATFTSAGTASTFPVAFPSACYSMSLCVIGSASINVFAGTSAPTTTGFTGYLSGTSNTVTVKYIAIGY